jgi:molecular chaperone GrpE
MTRKKHDAAEEIIKKEAGEVADNLDINSQDNGVPVEDVYQNGKEVNLRDVEVSGEAREQETNSAPAKETNPEDSAVVKLAEMQDRYLRLSAEFDNYRKRTLREKIELTKHASEDILISIVPVMDDFERALKLMESSTDIVAMKAGIDLIYAKFGDFLKQNGIKEIESLHKEFNVDLHDAVSKTPVQDENLKGKVVDVLQKGYFLHGKVMRFSKVVVGE